LNNLLKNYRREDFIFQTPRGHLLSEIDFKKEFRKQIGENFYPHIVRSYFATKATEDFLKTHKNPKKSEVKNFLLSVADELGHKKMSKKTGEWEDNYSVTVGHYIDPRLVAKLRRKL
jgi:hypothetical protein